jgi:hypothetical protein
LLKRRFAGFPQKELLDLVVDQWEASYLSDIQIFRSVEQRLTSKGLKGKLEAVSALGPVDDLPAGLRQLIINVYGGIDMSDQRDQRNQSVSVTAGAGGQVAGVVGGSENQQIIGSINQESNSLPALADALVQALADMRTQLAPADVPSDIDGVADLASSIQDEAKKPQPDKGKLGRLVGKVKEWATKIGPPALQVLIAAGKIAGAIP